MIHLVIVIEHISKVVLTYIDLKYKNHSFIVLESL